tara:strand:- start:336 stop:551 length:216 start_codon:yes stop_codon:yes gene_type:complete
MLAQLFSSLLVKAYTLEQGMKSKPATTIPERPKRIIERPYYDAKEIMDNGFSSDGLTPIGYYIEEVEDDKG